MAVHFKHKVKPKVKGLGAKKKVVLRPDPPSVDVPAKHQPYQTKWRDDQAFRLYELFKAGHGTAAVAHLMGVRAETVNAWVDKLPLAKAAKAAALAARDAESETFADYVHSRLPADLVPVWKEIESAGMSENPVERIEAALAGKGKRGRQWMFLHALVTSNFNVTEASRKTNIDRRTFQLWMKNDDGFARIIDQIYESKKDLVEGKLFQLIEQGDTSAVLFASRTLNKDRGYGDSKTIKVDQTTTHRHLIDIDELDLTLEVRRAILEALRKKQAPDALTDPTRDPPQLPAVREPVDVFDALADDE